MKTNSKDLRELVRKELNPVYLFFAEESIQLTSLIMSENINVDLVAIQKYQNIYIKIYELLVGRIRILMYP